MKTQIKKSYLILIVCAAVLLVAGGLAAIARRRQRQLPPIICKVKQLEVVSVAVEGQDEPEAVIEIKNNSDKPVISVAVEAGEGNDAAGTNLSGIREGELPPLVVIEPHSSTKVNFSLSNLKYFKPGTPIKVSGVLFADGTEDGDEYTLGTMHRQKEHDKAKKSQKEEGTSQQ
jgi:hypothetical protein